MKTLIILSLFLIPTLSFAQKESKIIVTATDTSNLLNRIAAVLYDNGFTMEEKDESVGFLLTKPKFERKVVGSRKIKAFIKGSEIEFTGLCRVELSNADRENGIFDTVQNRGMKGSITRVAWDEMLEIAKQFGTQITYSK